MVVLSIWREGTCVGSFRLDVEDVPALVDFLREGLAREYDAARASLLPGMRPADGRGLTPAARGLDPPRPPATPR